MFDKPSVGYPILDGDALVKVSLKDAGDGKSWIDRLVSSTRHFLVNLQVKSYYHGHWPEEPVPVVNLDFPAPSVSRVEDLEVDLFRDSLSLQNRFKSAMGALAAAGFMLVSAMGFANGGPRGGNDGQGIILFSPGEKREGPGSNPEISIRSDRENQLWASLVPGIAPNASNRHYFRLSEHNNVSHTNLASGHTNTGQEYPHENLYEPHGNHSNHTNAPHVNHDNVPHSNAEANTHANNAHGNHSNLGSLDVHLNVDDGAHANSHANEAGDHTDLAS